MNKSNVRRSTVTDFLIPKSIVLSHLCKNVEMVLEENPRQSMLSGELAFFEILKGGYIILDFGAEIQGGITISILDVAPNAKIRLVFGESISETMSEIGVHNATNDHSIRDTVLDVASYQTFNFGNTGFRFVKLEAVSCDIKISCVQASYVHRQLEYKGKFECNDELLNDIWEIGAYTVSLNMQEYLWDGIKRDRLVWVGDMHPETMSILAVFDDYEVVHKSLDLVRDKTSPNKWMNGIPSYNLWWIRIHADLYKYTANIDYLREQEKYLYEMTEHIISHIDENGVHDIEYTFCEWSSAESEYEAAGFQALLALALDDAAFLGEVLGNAEVEQICKRAASAVRHNVYPYEGNKQVAAMTMLADMGDADKIAAILKKGNSKGLSTFWGFYVLQALYKSGCRNELLNIIREYWGGMIKMGATTFWEDFDVEWMENAFGIDEIPIEGKRDIHADFGRFCYTQLRHSLCHGWASGPTAFLNRYIAGIEPIEPGFKKVRVKPDLCGLEWIKCTQPTPYGDITVEVDASGLKIDAPQEIEIIQE